MLANAQHDNAEVEDLSVAVFRYGRGLAQLTSSVVHHGEEQEIVVQGQNARVSQPWSVVAEKARPDGFPEHEGDAELVARIEKLAADLEPLPHLGHAGQIGDLIDAIRTGRPPIADAQDGRNAVELVTAIYKAGFERSVVALPLSSDDPYYRAGYLVEAAPRFYEKRRSLAEAAA
jgi:predicted dehydrogenase